MTQRICIKNSLQISSCQKISFFFSVIAFSIILANSHKVGYKSTNPAIEFVRRPPCQRRLSCRWLPRRWTRSSLSSLPSRQQPRRRRRQLSQRSHHLPSLSRRGSPPTRKTTKENAEADHQGSRDGDDDRQTTCRTRDYD